MSTQRAQPCKTLTGSGNSSWQWRCWWSRTKKSVIEYWISEPPVQKDLLLLHIKGYGMDILIINLWFCLKAVWNLSAKRCFGCEQNSHIPFYAWAKLAMATVVNSTVPEGLPGHYKWSILSEWSLAWFLPMPDHSLPNKFLVLCLFQALAPKLFLYAA